MKKERYDDELLRQYLLGLLPEQETERLDELSFTDDEMAARLRVVENDLVDAYVVGELNGPTRNRFDSYYISSPSMREKVAGARGLQYVIDRVVIAEQTGKLTAGAEPSPKAGLAGRKGFPGSRFFVWMPALQWGLAAALLLMIAAGGWIVVENLRLRHQWNRSVTEREELQKRETELQTRLGQERLSGLEKEQELERLRDRIALLEQRTVGQQRKNPQPPEATEPNIVAVALAPQKRGVSQIVDIPVSAQTEYVTMQLELEPSDFTIYRAELKSQPAGEVVWKSRKLRAGNTGKGLALAVTVHAALLKLQRYEMEVYGITSGGVSEPISSYPFRVVR